MTSKENKCTGRCDVCGKCKGISLMQRNNEKNEMNERKASVVELPNGFQSGLDMTGYGVAFDLGTTTVVGILWDLENTIMVDTLAMANPQRIHGSDVISRITFCQNHEERLKLLQNETIACFNQIIEGFKTRKNIDEKLICRVIIAGNTTMSHIFGGYDPSSLALAPFAPAYTGVIRMTGKSSGLNINPTSTVTVMPNIDAHVGGDITAGLVATNLLEEKQLTVFVDIGTNGEIVLAEGQKALTCSAAAGPAFEAASIFQGMRAETGAVESVSITNEGIYLKTIGNAEPIGFCGSGILDAVAELFKTGIIDSTGKLRKVSEHLDERGNIRKQWENVDENDKPLKTTENFGQSLLERVRIRKETGVAEFVFAYKENGEDLVVTQKDIREVQMAKAAILAGIEILLRKVNRKVEDIQKLLIAGAFGNYINKESALKIGLIPPVHPSLIHYIGNTAGIGASMVLLSHEEEKKALDISVQVKHVELAEEHNFQQLYFEVMGF